MRAKEFYRKYDINVDELRGILDKREKIFETNELIIDTNCIDFFFESVSHIVLPYDDSFLGLSGVMLQALSYGTPLLVRHNGLYWLSGKKIQIRTYVQREFFTKTISPFY